MRYRERINKTAIGMLRLICVPGLEGKIIALNLNLAVIKRLSACQNILRIIRLRVPQRSTPAARRYVLNPVHLAAGVIMVMASENYIDTILHTQRLYQLLNGSFVRMATALSTSVSINSCLSPISTSLGTHRRIRLPRSLVQVMESVKM